MNVYNGLSIIPTKMLSLSKSGVDWKEKFKIVARFYDDGLPNSLALDAELLLWNSYWLNYDGTLPDNIAKTLKAICCI